MINNSYINITKEDNGLVYIEMNNPPVNALSLALVHKISRGIDSVENNAKVIVFQGSGKGFCAGADLKERAGMTNEETIDTVDRYRALFEKIENISCPTIARIHGFALGGGLELSLSCDFRFSSKDALIGFPEVSIGIIPGAGGTQRMLRLVGPSKAKEWIFTAEKYDAEKALKDNVVDFVFENETIMDKNINEFSKKILGNSSIAVGAAKKAISGTLNKTLNDGLQFERDQYLKTLADPVRIETLKKFKK